MPNDPEVRVRYLSFGLFAQKVIDVLIEFADEGKDDRLDRTLSEAIECLSKPSRTTGRGSAGKPARLFRSYEQVRTLEETLGQTSGATDRGEVIQMLQQLLQRRGSRRTQRRIANRVIDFFFDLENRALRNVDQPEPPPHGLRELCQA
jgi:hypothetical protein